MSGPNRYFIGKLILNFMFEIGESGFEAAALMQRTPLGR